MKTKFLLFLSMFGLGAMAQTQIDLPITWDDANVNYLYTDFGGNGSTIMADPMNANNMVLQSVKDSTAQLWAGTTLSDTNGLATAIPFASGATTISVDVYSPDAGIQIRLKAEDKNDPTKSVETEATTTMANQWETLVFDFSNQATGTAAIDFSFTYDMLSIFYNFGVDGATAGIKTYYCDDVTFGGSSSGPSTYNVTFQVDMTTHAGGFTTPEVNGTFNSWCGNCNAMSDANGDGIWDVTLPITADSIEFKYSFDNWAGQEDLTNLTGCTKTDNGFTNRFMHLTGDTVLPAVCWESCDPCAGSPGIPNVTFRLNMNDHPGGFTTPEVNGTFNSWCGNCAAMSDADMDGIWEITIPIEDDSVEFKYSYDNWAGQEDLTGVSGCTKTDGTFTNRFITITGDTTLPVVCWESCTDCTGQPTTADVTFKVDLSEYTGTYNQVHLNGTFNNWCGTCAEMTSPNNDNIYELTVSVPTDSIEYKFTLDGWTVDEQLTDGSWCTKTTVDGGGTFVNRTLVPMADTTLPAVCWESCEECVTSTSESTLENLQVLPNPSNGQFNLRGFVSSSATVTVHDMMGRVIYNKAFNQNEINEMIDLTSFEEGVYILNIETAEGAVSKRVVIKK